MSDEDTYEIPLQNQRAFGAGIRRTKVKFVPSSDSSSATVPASNTPAKSVSDFYLNLVLPKDQTTNTIAVGSSKEICEICSLPFSDPIVSVENAATTTTASRSHEASLAHQVCLTHSHPPSHLDRSRKGLGILSSYGWDLDSRRGLGATEQGIQFPIKAKPKDDKMGIGLVLPPESQREKKTKMEKLDAGKVRKLYEKDRKKAEKLREMFYRSDDLERYLGGD